MFKIGRMLSTFTLAAMLAVVGGIRAGTVVLKNGDRITGTITRVGAAHVTVKTAYAGIVSIAISDIKTLSSNTPVVLAPAKASPQMATLAPAPSGTGWTANPVALPVPPQPKPPTKPAKPISWFGPNWHNEMDLGAMDAAGNSNSTQFTGALNLHYHFKPNEVNINVTGGYGMTNDVQSLGFFETDEIWRRALDEFKPKWAKKLFLFAENDNRYDAILGISIRSNNDAGLGYYLFETKKMELDVRGGPGYSYERFFHGQSVSYINGTAGLHFMYRIDDRTKFTQTMQYISSLENSYNYQASATSAISFDLPEVARGFGLRASFTDNYDNTAGELGRKRNDTLIIGSVFFKF